MCDAFNNANNKIVIIVCNGNAITNDLMGKIVCDVRTNENVFLGLTVCDIHTDGNVFLGFTMWDVHTYGNVFLGLPCGMYIPTEMIGFRCLARSHTALACVPGGPIPDDLWVMWEGPPLSPTLTWRRFQMPSRKGVKNRLLRTEACQ